MVVPAEQYVVVACRVVFVLFVNATAAAGHRLVRPIRACREHLFVAPHATLQYDQSLVASLDPFC